MRRRDFIKGMAGSAAATWSLAALAKQAEQVRRIGVLMHSPSTEPEAQARLAAFLQGMRDAGWEVGRNLRVEYRWSVGDTARLLRDAKELVALNPDAILAGVGATTPPLLQATRVVPIVFAQGVDPVGNQYVDSLSRPGGNITGFVQLNYGLAGKWLELLKEVAPQVTHVAMLREPGAAAIGQWAVMQEVARSMNVEVKPIEVREAGDIERAVSAFAQSPNSGMVTAVSAGALNHKDLIIKLATQYRLPVVYSYRVFVTSGGLMSYATDIIGQYKRVAGYVDRILKGEKPAELPVQDPNKYELVINLKSAKAIGLTVPPSLLSRTDEIIE
ncbi:MAG: ABC transporter substrate-binding protein [Pseudolabrys sp.]|jgi:putative ABC transport system substrate-binding protein